LTGLEIPLLQGIEYSTLNGAGQFDIAANGTLIYRPARAGSYLKTVQWMDHTGRLETLLGTPGDSRAISLSRDGKRLAIVKADSGGSALYVYDVERHHQPVRLTVGANIRLEGGGARELAWNPDGRYLFFSANDATWWVPTEGLSQSRALIKTWLVSTISHDGTRLFGGVGTPKTRGDAWIVPLSVGRDGPQAGRPESLLREPYTEIPLFDSPDGRWAGLQCRRNGNLANIRHGSRQSGAEVDGEQREQWAAGRLGPIGTGDLLHYFLRAFADHGHFVFHRGWSRSSGPTACMVSHSDPKPRGGGSD
jgi:hypothetical protein